MRTHFKHSVELVDREGEIADHLAGVEDFLLAQATSDGRRNASGCAKELESWRTAMIRIEQRGAVAFTCMGVAVLVILLITLFGHLF